MSKDFLTLKWGTLKAWDFSNNKKAKKLLKEYNDIGSCWGAAQQKDTPRQKEIICELIDVCTGEIHNNWSGKIMSKKEAKEYVTNKTK